MRPGLILLTVVWGLVLPVFGMTQTRILPGSGHWVIRVLHLLVGLGALRLAEALATRITGRTEVAAAGASGWRAGVGT